MGQTDVPRPVTTDETSTDPAAEQQQGTAFHEELANDRIAQASDRTREGVANQSQIIDPMDLIRAAERDAQELYQLGSKQKWDRIQVRDASTGQVREMTVEERTIELKAAIKAGTEKAIGIADALPQEQVTKDLQANTVALDAAAKTLNVNLQAVSPEQLQQIAAMNTPQSQEFIRLLQEREQINMARFAPALTRIVAATFRAEGMTDPEGQIATAQNPTPKPSAKEISDAMTMLEQAKRSGDNGVPGQQSVGNEVANSRLFLDTSARIYNIYSANQQERGQSIIANMREAQELKAQGRAEEAGAKLKAAYDTAETIDYTFIKTQLADPRNANNPQVKQAFVDVLNNGYQARTNYAKHLRDTGKFEDALPILIKVEADTAELAVQDPTFGKLKQDAMFGTMIPAGELEAHQVKFQEAITNKDFTAAQKEIDFLRANYQKTADQLDKGDKKLQEEHTKVKAELEELKKNEQLNAQQQADKKRLEDELAILEQNLKTNDAFKKQYPQIQYLAGVLEFSKGDNKAAHALFEEVKKTSPEIAGNKDMRLDEMLEATRDKGWFERNWDSIKKGLCIGAAVLAGVAVGALTIWTGPGAAVFGAGTTAALLTTMGVAAGAGFVAGGTAGTAMKFTTEGFDTSKINLGRDFVEYGIYGAAASTAVAAAPGFAAAAPAQGAFGTSAIGLKTASVANFAVSRVAPAAIYGYGSSGGQAVLSHYADGVPWDQAAKQAALQGTINTAAYAFMPTFGNSAAAAGSAPVRETVGAFAYRPLTVPLVGARIPFVAPTGAGTAVASMEGFMNTGVPAIGDAYKTYSPWRIAGFSRPDKVHLNPTSPEDEKEMWDRYYNATK